MFLNAQIQCVCGFIKKVRNIQEWKVIRIPYVKFPIMPIVGDCRSIMTRGVSCANGGMSSWCIHVHRLIHLVWANWKNACPTCDNEYGWQMLCQIFNVQTVPWGFDVEFAAVSYPTRIMPPFCVLVMLEVFEVNYLDIIWGFLRFRQLQNTYKNVNNAM